VKQASWSPYATLLKVSGLISAAIVGVFVLIHFDIGSRQNWSYQHVIDHLRYKYSDMEQFGGRGFHFDKYQLKNDDGIWLLDRTHHSWQAEAILHDGIIPIGFTWEGSGMVYCRKYPSFQAAKEEANRIDMHTAYAWGPFFFHGDPYLISSFKGMLGKDH
jgi:hypothetical protein